MTNDSGKPGFGTFLHNRKNAINKRINKDEGLLNDYLSAVKISPEQASANFANMFKDASEEARAFAAAGNLSTESINRFIGAQRVAMTTTKSLGASLKALAVNFAVVAANVALVAFASWGIDQIGQGLEAEANKVENARDALQGLSQGWKKTSESTADAKKVVDNYAASYEKLSKGVNTQTGENVSLSEDEYNQWLSINAKIADSTLSTVEGVNVLYDKQGNAIVQLTNKTSTLADAYGKLADQARAQIIADADKTMENVQTAGFTTEQAWWDVLGISKASNDTKTANAGLALLQKVVDMRGRGASEDELVKVFKEGFDEDTTGYLAAKQLIAGLLSEGQAKQIKAELQQDLQADEIYSDRFLAKAVGLIDKQIAAKTTIKDNELQSVVAPAKQIAQAALEQELTNGQYGLTDKAQEILVQSLSNLAPDFFAGKTGSDIVAAATQFGQAFEDLNLQQSINDLATVQEGFFNNKATFGDLQKALEIDWGSVDEVFVDAMLKSFGLDNDSVYITAANRAQEIITDATSEYISGLGRKELDFIRGLETKEYTMAEIGQLYNDRLVQDTTSLEAVSNAYKGLIEQQDAATKAIKGISSDTSISLEDYQNLIAANKDYADAITNNAGYMTVDYNKIRSINQKQIVEAAANVDVGWAQNLSEQARLQQEIRSLVVQGVDAQNKDLIIKQEQLKTLQKEADQYKILANQYKYMSSSYKRWLDAKDVEEASAGFSEGQNALKTLQEGQKSGRRNTEAYKAANEYIFGNRVFKSEKERNKAITDAQKLYNEDGSLNLKEWRRQSLAHGAQDKNGAWQVNSIQDYAKAMGWSEEYTAQAIKALSEYNGYQGVNVSDEWIKAANELLPQSEVEANTTALETNTSELQSLNETLGKFASNKDSNPEVVPDNYNGNVDLENRPIVSGAKMRQAGWKEYKDDEYATLYGSTITAGNGAEYELGYNQNVIINYTPILPDGTVYSPDAVQEYIQSLIEESQNTGKSLLEVDADRSGILLGVQPVTENLGTVLTQNEKYMQKLHELQADWDQKRFGREDISELAQENDNPVVMKVKAVVTEIVGDEGVELSVSDVKAWISAYAANMDDPELAASIAALSPSDVVAYIKSYAQVAEGASTEDVNPTIAEAFIQALTLAQGYTPPEVVLEATANIKGTAPDGKLHVPAVLDIEGTKESVEEAEQKLNDINNQDSLVSKWFGVTTSDDIKALTNQAQYAKKSFALLGDWGKKTELNRSLAETLDRNEQNNIVSFVAEAVAAINNGEALDQSVYDRLSEIQQLADAYGQLGAGSELIANIAAGMTNAGYETTADQVAQNLKTAIDTAMGGYNLGEIINSNLSMDAAVAKVDSAKAQMAQPVTIPVRANITGLPTIQGLTKLASGTDSAKGGTSLVGEAGREIWVDTKKNRWSLIDEPSLLNLNKGDIVYNNKQTEAMLKSRKSTSGKAFADGLHIGGGTTKNSNGKDNGGNNNNKKSKSISSILKELDKLYDWIPKLLEQARKATERLVKDVQDFVGHVAQNAQLQRALASVTNEMEKNQEAYARYVSQANSVQKKLKMSDSLVAKIQNGEIDIKSLDTNTKKKVEAYKKWWEAAEQCLDTIEELKDQEHELMLQRIDNIIKDYDNRLDQLADEEKSVQDQIKLEKQLGREVSENQYQQMIANEQNQLAVLTDKYNQVQSEFLSQVASGNIKTGSEEWHKYRNELEGINSAIVDAQINISEFGDEIYNLRTEKLSNVAATLQQIQAVTEGIIGLHDAQGTNNVSKYYADLIANGHDQIANLEEQNQLLKAQMDGLDQDSEKYQEYLQQVRENENEIMGLKTAQEQWNDAIADLKINNLQEQKEELEKVNDAYEKQLRYSEALEALEKAKTQRNKLVYREGQGFVYQTDQEAIDEAQKKLDELEKQMQIDRIDEEIQQIEDQKKTDNVWDYSGTQLLKPNSAFDVVAMSRELANAMSGMGSIDLISTVQEEYSKMAETLRDMEAKRVSIEIGDINLTGVDNTETLAKDIVQNLPNSIMQELYKN